MNTKEVVNPDELAMSVAAMSTEAKTWLESSIMVCQTPESIFNSANNIRLRRSRLSRRSVSVTVASSTVVRGSSSTV
jgi:hypothetical protein